MFDKIKYRKLLDDCHAFNKKLAEEKWPEIKDEPIGFLYDGPIDIENWDSKKIKTLFVAQEHYGFWDCEPREIYYEKNFGITFHKRIAWFTGLLSKYFQDNSIFNEEELNQLYYDNAFLENSWNDSALIEVKKISGDDSSADYHDIYDNGTKNKYYITEQIKMINPDIIFCCGKVIFDLYTQQLNVFPIDNYFYNYDQWCYFSGKKIVINSQHPSWRYFRRKHAYQCIVNELRKK